MEEYGDCWIQFQANIEQFGGCADTANASFDKTMSMRLIPVEYDLNRIKDEFKEMILRFTQSCEGDLNTAREYIGSYLSYRRISIKSFVNDNGFINSSEREIRLVVFVPVDKEIMSQLEKQIDLEIVGNKQIEVNIEDAGYVYVFSNNLENLMTIKNKLGSMASNILHSYCMNEKTPLALGVDLKNRDM